MYITWKYDTFPYLLCGKVVGKIDKDGYYHIKGYDGMRFKAKSVISDNKKGKAVQLKIEELDSKYRELKEYVAKEWSKELNSFIKKSI